jgi:HD-like signal output (HDOD) protein
LTTYPEPGTVSATATLRCLCNLPRLNANALRLLALSAQADATLEEFEDIFGSDSSLAAEILRVANSVEFGQRARVTHIKMALMVLGIDRTRCLGASIVMNQYTRGIIGESEIKLLWRHGVASAIVAEELGRRLPHRLGYLYTAGLTHDLGRSGLVLLGRERYLDLMRKEFQNIEEAVILEKAILGVTHCEAGLFLAQSWNFPAVLRQSIGSHHDPPGPHDDDSQRIVRGACLLAGELGYPEVPGMVEASPGPAAEELRAGPEEQERLREAIERRLQLI